MNDKNIQEILKIEKQAQAIYDAAVREAEQLPLQAEQEAQSLIEKARADAQNEARELISRAEAKEEANRILTEAEGKAGQMEASAKRNFDKAVAFVLKQVVNRE